MKKIASIIRTRNFKVASGMVIGSIIYCIGIVFILDLGNYVEGGTVFYAGGVTGISQLITNTIDKLVGRTGVISKSVFILILNIPLIVLGFKTISKRFTMLSVCSVLLQTSLIFVLEILNKNGWNPLIKVYERTHDTLSLAILGGLVIGVGAGLVLRSGASSGGMDILSQYMLLKKEIPFTKFSLTVDIVIIAISALLGSLEIAIYTIIRFIISALVLDKVYTIYNYIKLSIVTDKKDEVRIALIERFNHGITIFKVTGGYTNQDKYVIETVVSRFEAEEYKNIVTKIDPMVFITHTPVKKIDGKFNKNLIT